MQLILKFLEQIMFEQYCKLLLSEEDESQIHLSSLVYIHDLESSYEHKRLAPQVKKKTHVPKTVRP
jgi:hypothetical protein